MKIDLKSLSFYFSGKYEYVTNPPYLADIGAFVIDLENYSFLAEGSAFFGKSGFFEFDLNQF